MSIRFCLLIACFSTTAFAQSIGFSLSPQSQNESPISVSVQDDKTHVPITDADVRIEDGGQNGLKTVTVARKGYSTLTLMGVQTGHLTAYLKPLPPEAKDPVAQGTMGSWNFPEDTDLVRAGVIMRSLSVYDLLSLDPSSFLSPLRDVIDVWGDREIPSNLVLPKQEIRVFFRSIDLNKPTYRLPLTAGVETRLVGIKGEIAVSDMMPIELQGPKLLELDMSLLNKVKFQQIALSNVIKPVGDTKVDVTGYSPLVQKHQVTPQAAPFGDVMVAAVNDVNGDRLTLVPTDIKVASTADDPGSVKTVKLMGLSQQRFQQSATILTVAMAARGKRVSGIISEQAGPTVKPGAFLAASELQDGRGIPDTVTVSAPSQGLGAAVFESKSATGKVVPIWFVYALPAAKDTQIATATLPERNRISTYSIMQLEFAPAFNENEIDGGNVMRTLKRFTRSFVKVR